MTWCDKKQVECVFEYGTLSGCVGFCIGSNEKYGKSLCPHEIPASEFDDVQHAGDVTGSKILEEVLFRGKERTGFAVGDRVRHKRFKREKMIIRGFTKHGNGGATLLRVSGITCRTTIISPKNVEKE